MTTNDYIKLEFPSISTNEGFARSAVGCFAARLDPTLAELGDIKTAVSKSAGHIAGSGIKTGEESCGAFKRVFDVARFFVFLL